jgi:hypothetical protein
MGGNFVSRAFLGWDWGKQHITSIAFPCLSILHDLLHILARNKVNNTTLSQISCLYFSTSFSRISTVNQFKKSAIDWVRGASWGCWGRCGWDWVAGCQVFSEEDRKEMEAAPASGMV